MSISTKSAWASESPLEFTEGEQPVFTFTVPGVTTITDDATLVTKVYKNGSYDAALSTGSMVVSGNSVTAQKVTGMTGPNNYVVDVWGTADNVYRLLVSIELKCRKAGSGM